MIATENTNILTRTGMMFNNQDELIKQSITVIHGGATVLIGNKLFKRYDIIMSFRRITAADGSWYVIL